MNGSGKLVTQRPSNSRVTGLDAARVVATFGIVWVHVAEIQGQPAALCTLGRFGTSFYTLAALFLSSRAFFLRKCPDALGIVKRRATRLLVPYLLWCVLYACFYFSTMYPQGHPVDAITRNWGPFFGTAPHLWFLPFAFCAGALSTFAVPRLMKLPGWFLIGGGSLITLGVYVYIYGWGYHAVDQRALNAYHLNRLDRWVEEVPLVCGALFGLATYGKYIHRLARIGRKKRIQLAWVSFCLFLVTQLCYALFLDDLGSLFWNRVRFFANIAGALWLISVVSARDSRWTRRIAPLGRATYFAYLSHQMILDSIKGQLTSLPGYGSLGFALLSSLLIFATAVSLGLLVARVKLLKFLSP